MNAGLGAAWKVAEVEEGSTVAIFGLGAVGLSVLIRIHLKFTRHTPHILPTLILMSEVQEMYSQL